jgi:hypothetical protein
MLYWLDSFTRCLLSLFHQCMGSNLTSYTELWPAGVWPRAGPPFGHLYVEVCFGTWRLVARTGRVGLETSRAGVQLRVEPGSARSYCEPDRDARLGSVTARAPHTKSRLEYKLYIFYYI